MQVQGMREHKEFLTPLSNNLPNIHHFPAGHNAVFLTLRHKVLHVPLIRKYFKSESRCQIPVVEAINYHFNNFFQIKQSFLFLSSLGTIIFLPIQLSIQSNIDLFDALSTCLYLFMNLHMDMDIYIYIYIYSKFHRL